MGDMTYKVHLDGDNNLDLWTGKTDKSARNQYFYYDESDLTGVRVGDWKMFFAIKEEGLWWDPLVYPSVPYLFNLRMDPMELFDPHSPEWGYMGRKLFAEKLWTLVPAQEVIARAHEEPAGVAAAAAGRIAEHAEGHGSGDEAAREGPWADPMNGGMHLLADIQVDESRNDRLANNWQEHWACNATATGASSASKSWPGGSRTG